MDRIDLAQGPLLDALAPLLVPAPQFRLRVVMDTLPLTAKALVTLLCVSGRAGPAMASLPPALIFSLSQLSLAIVSCLGYWVAGARMLHSWEGGAGEAGRRLSASDEARVGSLELDGGEGVDGSRCGGPELGGASLVRDVRGDRVAGGHREGAGKSSGGIEHAAGGVGSSVQRGWGMGGREGRSNGGRRPGRSRIASWGPAQQEALATSGIFAVQAVSA